MFQAAGDRSVARLRRTMLAVEAVQLAVAGATAGIRIGETTIDAATVVEASSMLALDAHGAPTQRALAAAMTVPVDRMPDAR